MLRKVLLVLCLIAGIFMLWVYSNGCSGTSSSGNTTVAFDSIDDLPKATDPVVDAASGNIIVPTKSVFKTATTGIKLADIGSSITADSSIAACEMSNYLKNIFNAGAQADLIQCYVGNTFAASNQSVNIYDGSHHVIGLNDTSGGDTPDKVKLKIVRNAAGLITSFEMFACRSGSQTEYVGQTLAEKAAGGYDVVITALGTYGGDQGSGEHYVTVTGETNAAGSFTTKTIATRNTNESADEANTNWGEAIFVQGADSYTFDGYNKGAYNGGTFSGTYEEAGYSEGQLINPSTGNMQDTALGDGAVKYNLSNTYDDGAGNSGTWTEADTEGWNGDTAVVDATTAADWIALADLGTYPAATGTTPTVKTSAADVEIAFTEAQTYTCGDEVEVTVDIPSNLDDATVCGQYSFGYEWTNCYELIEVAAVEDAFAGQYTHPENCGAAPSPVMFAKNGNIYSVAGQGVVSFTFNGTTCSEPIYGVTAAETCTACTVTGTGDAGTTVAFTGCNPGEQGECEITFTKQ